MTTSSIPKTMVAARVHPDRKLYLDEIEVPKPLPGAVLLKTHSVYLWSYTGQVVDGSRKYKLPELPCVLGVGGFAEVVEVGENVFDLEPGEMVHVDPRVGSDVPDAELDEILIGWTATTALGPRQQKIWKDGTVAEYCLSPAKLLVKAQPNRSMKLRYNPTVYASMSFLILGYSGLMRGDFKPGCTVMINGATGSIGSGAVVLALEMGASRVYAVGRNATALKALEDVEKRIPNPGRLVTVSSVGTQKEISERLTKACGKVSGNSGVDIVLDVVGNATSETTEACVGCLKPYGIIVIEGSLQEPLKIDYRNFMRQNNELRGCYMFTSKQMQELVGLVNSGIVDLSLFVCEEFPLSKVSEAIARASEVAGGLKYVVVNCTKAK